jgi:hypothetical protein
MLRPDSFTITFNLPPEIIREYYDGLAKVETAKNSKPSSKSNLSSILNSCKPILNKFCDKSDAINSKIAIGVGLDDETLKDFYKNVKYLNDILKDEPTVPTPTVPTPTETTSSVSTPTVPTPTVPTPTETTSTETTPSVSTPTETTQKETTPTTKENKKPKDKKIKKPYYQDGDNVVVDLNSIAGVFGDNANNGNIGDMMKMFAPMMEGLMGNLNQQKQNVDNKQTTENKPTESKNTDSKTADS